MTFLGLLTVVFIVLKLLHVIAWSWWLVLLPLYGGWVVVIALALVAGTISYLRTRP